MPRTPLLVLALQLELPSPLPLQSIRRIAPPAPCRLRLSPAPSLRNTRRLQRRSKRSSPIFSVLQPTLQLFRLGPRRITPRLKARPPLPQLLTLTLHRRRGRFHGLATLAHLCQLNLQLGEFTLPVRQLRLSLFGQRLQSLHLRLQFAFVGLQLAQLRRQLIQPSTGVARPLLGDQAFALTFRQSVPDRHQPASRIRALALQVGQTGSQRLVLGLRRPQLCRIPDPRLVQRFQLLLDLRPATFQPLQFSPGQSQFQGQLAFSEFQISTRAAALPSQAAHLGLHLRDEVIDPRQVAVGLVQATSGDTATVLVATDPRRFLEHGAALFRPVAQDRVHHAALDDGVRVGAQPGIAAQLLHVTQAAEAAVQAILRLTARVHGTADLDLGIRYRQDVILVGEAQRHLGAMNRLAPLRPLEDRLFHPRAPDRCGALLAQHPAQTVGDVGLAAAVWPHDRRDPVMEADIGGIGE